MPRQFQRRMNGFRKRVDPPELVSSELRKSMQLLAESMRQCVKLLERFDEQTSEADQDPREPTARPDDGPLIPNRRSQLLAKIDMRRPLRRRQQ